MPYKSNTFWWEQAPMIRLIIPLIIGIVMYDSLAINNLSNDLLIGIFISVFLLLNILLLNRIKFNQFHFFIVQILLLFIGFSNAYWQDDIHHPNWMGRQIKDSTMSLAVIAKTPVEKHKTIRYEVSFLKTLGFKKNSDAKGTAYLYVYKKEGQGLLGQGDTILLPNKWQSISNSGNPFELDYKKHCARKNIYFQQFVSPRQTVLYAVKKPNTYSVLQKSQQYCIQSISVYIKDSTTSALLKAMLLGEEQDIDPQNRQAYSDTGIIHIISISGAHIGLLFFTINLLLGWLRSKKQVWIKYVISLGIIWFYVLLTGASAPALRAAIMFSIMAIAIIGQQQNNPLNQLFSAAFIILLCRPMWVFQIGFQLSFIAVLSLIVFYQPILSIWIPKSKIGALLSKSIAASLAAEILIAPLVAYYFHSFPPLFIVANIIASVAMTGILIMGMVLFIVAKVAVLAKAISCLIVLCSQIFHSCIYTLQLLHFQTLKTILISTTSLYFLYVLIIAATMLFLRKNKFAIWSALISLLLLSLNSLNKSWQIRHQQQLIVFNNSKGSIGEYIYGNTYQNLTNNDSQSYPAQSVHINLGLSRKAYRKKQSVYLFNNTKILLLDSNANIPGDFPIDILVVNGALKRDISFVLQALKPQKVILTSKISLVQIKEWENLCATSKVPLHNVKTDGAFVFP